MRCQTGWGRWWGGLGGGEQQTYQKHENYFKHHNKYIYPPLIGVTHICFENLKSEFYGFPAGFEDFGPRIRIPGEKLYI